MTRVLLCLALLFLGCHRGGSEPSPTPTPRYLFMAYWENHSMGKKQLGYVVEASGRLSTFDASEGPDVGMTPEARFTEAQLTALVSQKAAEQEVLPAAELQSWMALREGVRRGPLGEATSICADAGRFTYVVWDEVGGTYRPLLAYQTGDWRRENSDPDAQRLKALMIQRALKYKVAWNLNPNSANWCSGM